MNHVRVLIGDKGSRAFLVGLVLAWLSAVALCQSSEQPSQGPPGCERFDGVQIPVGDLPAAQDHEIVTSCGHAGTETFAPSVDLYFGIVHPVDPVNARKCAYLEREASRKTHQSLMEDGYLGGVELLTMIYANGKGAARSFDLALKFACEIAEDEDVPENKNRVERLVKLQNEHWNGSDYSVCDDLNVPRPTAGKLGCRHLQQHFEQVARDARLARDTVHWSSKETEALAQLRLAAAQFFQASSDNEVEVEMHGAGAYWDAEITQIEARKDLDDAFVADLERFEKGQLPQFSAAQFKESDARLNSQYKAVLAWTPDPGEPATIITPEGVKTTQRAWLRYREAWVAFGQAKYPGVTADSWRTWLSQQRAQMLEGVR